MTIINLRQNNFKFIDNKLNMRVIIIKLHCSLCFSYIVLDAITEMVILSNCLYFQSCLSHRIIILCIWTISNYLDQNRGDNRHFLAYSNKKSLWYKSHSGLICIIMYLVWIYIVYLSTTMNQWNINWRLMNLRLFLVLIILLQSP